MAACGQHASLPRPLALGSVMAARAACLSGFYLQDKAAEGGRSAQSEFGQRSLSGLSGCNLLEAVLAIRPTMQAVVVRPRDVLPRAWRRDCPGSSVVEHLLGKEEVVSSILILGSGWRAPCRAPQDRIARKT